MLPDDLEKTVLRKTCHSRPFEKFRKKHKNFQPTTVLLPLTIFFLQFFLVSIQVSSASSDQSKKCSF